MSPAPGAAADSATAGNAGLFAAARGLATTLVASARSRIELAGNDLELERVRILRTLILGVSALFCTGLGIMLLVGLILALNWESRVVVLAVFGGGFVAVGIGLFVAMQRANQRRQAFAATLAELEEDLRQLRAATGHEQPRA